MGNSTRQQAAGIKHIEAHDMRLDCFQSPTGIKFVLVTDKSDGAQTAEATLIGVYQLYSTYVLSTPFYNPEMPIRSDLFDHHLSVLLSKV
ncbi:Trafficking protein particle complex subunit 4 [Spiromyces aspiralis]|uniref:Trafficking protein particle complex subunit 4 n=1 Tax=Spiromyces aspiralis TaxID=68401 RepID=A0ACC1HPC9_9FUNG|nr:Trafficking protein particle complex subunit 4 [Spiromyces aspiralis]